MTLPIPTSLKDPEGRKIEIFIRPYADKDFDVVTSIWLRSWQSTGIPAPVTLHELRARWLEELANGWEVFVGIRDQEVVGFLALHSDKLEQLFIDPAHQGRGIGKQLLDYAKVESPRGFHLTTALQTRAGRFYEREGLKRGETAIHPRFGHQIVRYDWQVRKAACHCGELVLRCNGEPARVSLCHCYDCQRRTGSLFSIAAFYPKDSVGVINGETETFRRQSASGFEVQFHFCPGCGSNLWWEPARFPDMVGVAVGSFADCDFPMPEQAVWAEAQHRWLQIPGGLRSHARNPIRSPSSERLEPAPDENSS